MEINRRDALKLAGLGAVGTAALAVPLGGSVSAKSASTLDDDLMPRPFRASFVVPQLARPAAAGVDDEGPWQSYVITQRATVADILPTLSTPMWGYNAQINGPTIVTERGTRVIVRMRNQLPRTHPLFGHVFNTSTHLHGNASLPQYDGYASDVTAPGQAKTYRWPMDYQPARTLWYHDHPVHHTAENVYSGLVGQFHVHDEVERALLPQGRFDVPLTIQDAMFAADGGLGFDDRNHSGVYGDVVLVNGKAWPVMKVQRRVYRFRILNGSVSRSYRPVLSPEAAFHMVATDGGLVPRSQELAQYRHGVAERYEMLIDFSQFAAGQRVQMRNLSNPNVRDFDHTDKIMAFDVTDEPVDTSDPTWNTIPVTLASHPSMSLRREQAVRKRSLRLKKSDVTNLWSINDRTWDDVIDSGYREVFANVNLGDVEIWEIDNRSGGWNHPLHIHLIDFQILSRNGKPPFANELGPKDTVYMGEDEKVEVLARFGPHRGKYMIHCHNLSHEDHDMMVQYSVGLGTGQTDDNDPVGGAPPYVDEDASIDGSGSPAPYPSQTSSSSSTSSSSTTTDSSTSSSSSTTDSSTSTTTESTTTTTTAPPTTSSSTTTSGTSSSTTSRRRRRKR